MAISREGRRSQDALKTAFKGKYLGKRGYVTTIRLFEI